MLGDVLPVMSCRNVVGDGVGGGAGHGHGDDEGRVSTLFNIYMLQLGVFRVMFREGSRVVFGLIFQWFLKWFLK